MSFFARERLLFALLTLVTALLMTRGLIAQAGYTDAYYHFNAANQLVSGSGLTDTYLWTYISAPDSLPAPSHLYWMPLTSLTAALGMWLLNAPGNYAAAQLPFTLMFAGTAFVGYWLGWRLGGTRRHAWTAGLLTLFSGFFARYWGATDTFAPYALIGSLCLVCLAIGASRLRDEASPFRDKAVMFGLAGVLSALGHLTRADGVLLLLVGWIAIFWSLSRWREGIKLALIMTIAYVLVMSPFFIRNLNAIGTPLPVGGTQSIWYASYDELFNYPPQASPQTLFASGFGAFFESRWLALVNNFGTFVAVEGLVIMTPLMVIGLWRRRKDPFLRGFWLYALGLHVAMTFVFPFPGYRGGLFHSAAALIPWWAALGVVGLDDVVDFMARYRKTWNPRVAKRVFSAGLLFLALILTLTNVLGGQVRVGMPRLYTELLSKLPPDARVMINDPSQLYYFTGMGGVVLPNAAPEVIQEIAQKYDISYLLLEYATVQGQEFLQAPVKLLPIAETLPDFLMPIPLEYPNARLYAIE